MSELDDEVGGKDGKGERGMGWSMINRSSATTDLAKKR